MCLISDDILLEDDDIDSLGTIEVPSSFRGRVDACFLDENLYDTSGRSFAMPNGSVPSTTVIRGSILRMFAVFFVTTFASGFPPM